MKKVIIIAIAALMAIGIISSAHASEQIWGRVDSIDKAASTMKVWNGINGIYTLKVDSNSILTLNGKKIGIAEVPAKSNIKGEADKQSDGTYLAKNITITACPVAASVGGRVNSIDTASNTLKMWNRWAGEFSVKLAPNATIKKNSQTIKLSDVKVGDMIRFQATKQTDGSYLATSGDIGGCGPGKGKGGCGGGNGGGCRP